MKNEHKIFIAVGIIFILLFLCSRNNSNFAPLPIKTYKDFVGGGKNLIQDIINIKKWEKYVFNVIKSPSLGKYLWKEPGPNEKTVYIDLTDFNLGLKTDYSKKQSLNFVLNGKKYTIMDTENVTYQPINIKDGAELVVIIPKDGLHMDDTKKRGDIYPPIFAIQLNTSKMLGRNNSAKIKFKGNPSKPNSNTGLAVSYKKYVDPNAPPSKKKRKIGGRSSKRRKEDVDPNAPPSEKKHKIGGRSFKRRKE